jgi:hypothetical protein
MEVEMSLLIALVPLLSLLALVLLYCVVAALRGSRIVELKGEHERFTHGILEQDAAAQETLLASLLDGQSPAESLASFEKKRAALLPGACLEEPASWDSEELTEYARRRFSERLSEVNRKLFTGVAIIAVAIIAGAITVTAVIYQFTSGAAGQPPISPPIGTNSVDPMPAVGSDPFAAPQSAPTSTDPVPATPISPNSPSHDPGSSNTDNTSRSTTT